ncbi:hypothetical protein SCP_0501120 [Sparassis crispa]|uniref:Uncharacterized protein n=1 Tax=Sparassis crispa TaxID=139825 RepID=A0A401GLL5_9APHY|nr:hypothetical protein SCP_0501120 [Sparassis crispa]GBE83066.1 hypothetical protein SCP_0501120 [Sparassis crispa]
MSRYMSMLYTSNLRGNIPRSKKLQHTQWLPVSSNIGETEQKHPTLVDHSREVHSFAHADIRTCPFNTAKH